MVTGFRIGQKGREREQSANQISHKLVAIMCLSWCEDDLLLCSRLQEVKLDSSWQHYKMYRDSGPHSSNCPTIKSLTSVWVKPANHWSLFQRTIITFSNHVVFKQSRTSSEVQSSQLMFSFVCSCRTFNIIFICPFVFCFVLFFGIDSIFINVSCNISKEDEILKCHWDSASWQLWTLTAVNGSLKWAVNISPFLR